MGCHQRPGIGNGDNVAMLRTVAMVVAATSVTNAQSTRMCTIVLDVDYNGYDIAGGSSATDAAECEQLCLSVSACTHFTFAQAFNGCYLKNSGAGRRDVSPNLNAVSGVCTRYAPASPAPTTSPSSAPTESQAPTAVTSSSGTTCIEISPAGCCRTPDGGLGT